MKKKISTREMLESKYKMCSISKKNNVHEMGIHRVEIQIAPYNPHGTVHAELPHTALHNIVFIYLIANILTFIFGN